MAPIFSRHPFKAIATIALFAFAPPYFFILSVIYTFRSRRRVSSWSLKTALGNELMRLFFAFASHVRMKPNYASASKLKERYAMVQPGAPELYTGVTKHDKIKPTSMPAIWVPTVPSDPHSARIIIHFQGGAFVLAPEPVKTSASPAKFFMEDLGATTFYAQYRLARDDLSRFPAALQDSVSFYQHVLNQGFQPRNIIISGDSAGGGVAIGLVRYIESTKMLPPPRGVMLWSPWLDVSDIAITQYVKQKNFHIDFLGLELLCWGKGAYEPTPSYRTKETDCYLRPVEHPFLSQTPIFVNAGTVELLHDEISLFVSRMKGVNGNKVQYVETKDAMHDLLLSSVTVGFEEELQNAVQQAGAFFGLSKGSSGVRE
jgi:acetyl esterase/lipase